MITNITGFIVNLQQQCIESDSDTSTQSLRYLSELVSDASISSLSSYEHSSTFPLSSGDDPAIESGRARIFFDVHSKTLYMRDSDGYRRLGNQQDIFQGEIAGFYSGGNVGSLTDNIDRFSFVTDGNSISHGAQLFGGRMSSAGQSSKTDGYSSGGLDAGLLSTIEKFSFASPAVLASVANLTTARSSAGGASSASYGFGYTAGGSTPANSDVLDRFSFISEVDALDVGDLTAMKTGSAGSSSNTSAYFTGGDGASNNVIDKVTFTASVANAVNSANLSSASNNGAGLSSMQGYGYNVYTDLINNNIVDKFPFSSDVNASDVGDLTIQTENFSGGTSSTERGFIAGGGEASRSKVIQKFSFYTDGTSIDVGDLSIEKNKGSSQQY